MIAMATTARKDVLTTLGAIMMSSSMRLFWGLMLAGRALRLPLALADGGPVWEAVWCWGSARCAASICRALASVVSMTARLRIA